MLFIALIPGTCTDDEETADEKAGEQNTEQVEKKDSVLVNAHTVPVPVRDFLWEKFVKNGSNLHKRYKFLFVR